MPGLGTGLGIEVMIGIGAALPIQPEFAGFFRDQVFLDLEAHEAGEILRAFADEQVVVGFSHHFFGDERRSADAFDGGDRAGPLERPVHDGGIQLDDALGIGQAAVADAGVLRVGLDDVDAGDDGIEHIGAVGDHFVGAGHTGQTVGVLGMVAVGGGNDQGPDAGGLESRGRLCQGAERTGGHGAQAGGGDEFPAR